MNGKNAMNTYTRITATGRINEEIIELYRLQEDRPVAKVNRYYKTALIDKLQQNPSRQRQWIKTIRALRDKVAMQNSKNKL